MKQQRRYRYAVYGYPHPTLFTEVVGRYRWRLTAVLGALWFRFVSSDGALPHAWIRREEVLASAPSLPSSSAER